MVLDIVTKFFDKAFNNLTIYFALSLRYQKTWFFNFFLTCTIMILRGVKIVPRLLVMEGRTRIHIVPNSAYLRRFGGDLWWFAYKASRRKSPQTTTEPS